MNWCTHVRMHAHTHTYTVVQKLNHQVFVIITYNSDQNFIFFSLTFNNKSAIIIIKDPTTPQKDRYTTLLNITNSC